MAVLDAPNAALLLYHHALLILGSCLIAMLWAVSGAPYGVPRQLFFLFGVLSPMIQMFFSILLLWTPFQTNIFLLCPISFALILLLAIGAKRRSQGLKNRRWESDFRSTHQALLEGPDNAAAYLRKAELLESAGMREEALQSYRRAHEISTRTLSPFELNQIERRLGTRLKLPGKEPERKPLIVIPLPDLRQGWIFCLAASAPVYFLDRRLFVGVLSVWLFALWYHAAQRED